jgi:putative tricarboxylic transport membrane protein
MDSGEKRMERGSLLSRALASEWIPPGLFFIALGAAALWVSRGYPLGTLQRMGPGYFPRMLSIGMICLGVLIVRQGLPDLATGKELRGGPHRSFWLIPLSLVVFGLSVELFGVVIALALALAVAGFAHREARIVEIAISIVTLIVLCVLIFVVALKLPLHLWPEFAR